MPPLPVQQCVCVCWFYDVTLNDRNLDSSQLGFISLTLFHSHLVVVLPLLVFAFVVLLSDSLCRCVSLAYECVCLPMPVCVCAFSDLCSCVDVFLLSDR